MHYRVVYDEPGRLRVRYGVHIFSAEQGYGICSLLQQQEGVLETRSNHINGSILITYNTQVSRDSIISALDALRREDIPICAPSSEQVQLEAKAQFQCTLMAMAIRKLACDYLLPFGFVKLLVYSSAFHYVKRAIVSLWKGDINVDVLDGAAIAASLWHGSVKSASSVMMMLSLSEHIATYTRYRAKNILTQSLAINIDQVWQVTEGLDVLVPLSQIEAGDRIRIQMGHLIPVDGRITEGEATINESSMTGEATAAFKSTGKSVYAGTVIEEGMIVVEVTSKSQETRIAQILEMIEEGEEQKALSQSKMERIADGLVPYNFLLFGLVYTLSRDVHKALSVLMVDYSCAMKLVTPIAIISAMRQCAERHILVKGGKYLDSFAYADTIVFDKTGTLTSASPTVARVVSLGSLPEDEILRMAACLEEHFPHSVANAIVRAAQEQGLQHEERHTEVNYIVAHGICATYDGVKTVLGSRHYVLEDEKASYDETALASILESIGAYSPIFLARNDVLEGIICIEDPPRKEAARTITELRELGIERVIMLTGDNSKTAHAIAAQLGIDEVYAEVLPQDKADLIDKLRSEGKQVVMVGDGVNDAPALAKAHVSVALKDSSDIAREVADVVITNGHLDELVYLRKISSVLVKKIDKNFKSSVICNSTLLGMGLLGVDPTLTAFLHNGSTLSLAALNTRNLPVS